MGLFRSVASEYVSGRNRSIVVPEVHVFCAAGRTRDQKVRLMKKITDAVVEEFGASSGSVTVQIIEAPLADKMKGGIPFDER
ncbi:tautomerase family protein [Neorhizobium galegae]|uniref:tautomerase family protein n=1 Tax=Neorhizobium galegae TaxID=399 RepID=UPI002729DA3E|nr:tautomerase family protein [Neorhizobium galegae]